MPDYPSTKPQREAYELLVPEGNYLRFNSNFESGNLRKAVKISDVEYELLLDFDTETKGHTQWYYFSVQNPLAGLSVRFTILNMSKSMSLYQCGLKPLVYSVAKARQLGLGWHRDGSYISYGPSPYSPSSTRYSQLSFKYTFRYVEDVVYFAHCYPYTYTDLGRQLSTWVGSGGLGNILRVDSLCESLAHNDCPLLTITENVRSYPTWASELTSLSKSAAGRKLARLKEARSHKYTEDLSHKAKKGVVFMARAHPGESNSSIVLKGAIEFLLSDTRVARLLRRHFVFRVIPMLNPDGVVYGNTRTSLVGADLNRRWNSPSPTLHPTLFHAKRLIQSMSEEREIALVCDFHGHSIKKKVFMYGCKHQQPDFFERRKNALVRLLPLLLSRRTKLFAIRNCRFGVSKDREATSRVVFFKEMGIDRSYTLESSFYGPLEDGTSHMEERHFEEAGRELCAQLLLFVNRRVFRRKVEEAVQTVQSLKAQKDSSERRPPSAKESVETRTEAEATNLAEIERSEEQFVLEDAVNELNEYHEQLEMSSEEEAEETESSDSSDDERKKEMPVPEKPAAKPSRKLPRHSRPFSRPRLTRPENILARSQSPLYTRNLDSRAGSLPSKLREIPSKYMQFLANPPRARAKRSVDVTVEDAQTTVAAVTLHGELLKQLDAPNARVVIARSAGAFRSVVKGRTMEPVSLLRPTTSTVEPQAVKMSRIHSTLYVRKKLLWRPEDSKTQTRMARTGGGFRTGEESPSKEEFDALRTMG